MGLSSLYRIPIKCRASPGVGATYPMQVMVDVAVDEIAPLQFIWMRGLLKVILTVIPGTDAERRALRVYAYCRYTGVLRRTYDPCVDIASVSVVLRSNIIMLIF